MKPAQVIGIGFAAALAALAGNAHSAAPEGAEFSRFRPSMGHEDRLGILSPRTGPRGAWSFHALGDYSLRPLDGVHDRVDTHLGMSLSPSEWAEFSIAVPVTIWADHATGIEGPLADALDAGHIPAVRATLKFTPFANEYFAIGLAAPLEISTRGDTAQDTVDRSSANPQLLLELNGAMRLTANAGAVFRRRVTSGELTLGRAFTYGAALTIPVVNREHRFELFGTLQGETGLDQQGKGESPLEALAGFRWEFPFALALIVGAGGEVSPGLGEPDFRIVGGLSFKVGETPRQPRTDFPLQPYRPEGPFTPGPLTAAELEARVMLGGVVTLPVLSQAKGAPLGELRVVKLAPPSSGKAEVLPDHSIRYLPAPGFRGSDAFEYVIADGSGRTAAGRVTVMVDAPLAQSDRDFDGIPDDHDACPAEPETVNGFEDGDGCPDKAKPVRGAKKGLARRVGDQIVVTGKVFFQGAEANVMPKSRPILVDVARLMRENPDIRLLRIEGHTEDNGNPENLAISRRRAESVKAFLVAQGVEASRLTAEGFGPSHPIATNKTARGRQLNRRIAFGVVE